MIDRAVGEPVRRVRRVERQVAKEVIARRTRHPEEERMDDERAEHEVVEREDPEAPPRPEPAERHTSGSAPLVQEQARDEKPAHHEEQIDAERSAPEQAVELPRRGVVPDDRQDREASEAVERRIPGPRFARRHALGRR